MAEVQQGPVSRASLGKSESGVQTEEGYVRTELDSAPILRTVVFYNRQRRHSSITYEAPLPFEAMKSPGKVSTVRG